MEKSQTDALIVDIKLQGLESLLMYAQGSQYSEIRDMYLEEGLKYLQNWQNQRMFGETDIEYFNQSEI